MQQSIEKNFFFSDVLEEKLQEAVDTRAVEVVGNVVALHTDTLRVEETEEGTTLKKQWKKFQGREV